MVWFRCSILAKKGAKRKNAPWNFAILQIVFWKTRIHESSFSIHEQVFRQIGHQSFPPIMFRSYKTWTPKKNLEKKNTHHFPVTYRPSKKKKIQEKKILAFHSARRTTNPGPFMPSYRTSVTWIFTCQKWFPTAKRQFKLNGPLRGTSLPPQKNKVHGDSYKKNFAKCSGWSLLIVICPKLG